MQLKFTARTLNATNMIKKWIMNITWNIIKNAIVESAILTAAYWLNLHNNIMIILNNVQIMFLCVINANLKYSIRV